MTTDAKHAFNDILELEARSPFAFDFFNVYAVHGSIPRFVDMKDFCRANEPKEGWRGFNGKRWTLTQRRMEQIQQLFVFAKESIQPLEA